MLATLLATALLVRIMPNTLTRTEQTDGWRLLFDGKSLKGWESKSAGSTGSFRNYQLKIDFLPGRAHTNSGIFLRSKKKGNRTSQVTNCKSGIFSQPVFSPAASPEPQRPRPPGSKAANGTATRLMRGAIASTCKSGSTAKWSTGVDYMITLMRGGRHAK